MKKLLVLAGLGVVGFAQWVQAEPLPTQSIFPVAQSPIVYPTVPAYPSVPSYPAYPGYPSVPNYPSYPSLLPGGGLHGTPQLIQTIHLTYRAAAPTNCGYGGNCQQQNCGYGGNCGQQYCGQSPCGGMYPQYQNPYMQNSGCGCRFHGTYRHICHGYGVGELVRRCLGYRRFKSSFFSIQTPFGSFAYAKNSGGYGY